MPPSPTTAIFTLLIIALPSLAMACGRCAPLVRAEVFNAKFAAYIGLLMAPLVVIALLVWVISKFKLFN